MIKHRWLQIILMLILGLVLSGCWDAKDINERSFVMGVAFDLPDSGEGHVMTIEVPVLQSFATQSGGSGPTSVLFATEGTSVAQMATHFESRTWRELFLAILKWLSSARISQEKTSGRCWISLTAIPALIGA